MNDDQIYSRGGTEKSIENPFSQNGTNSSFLDLNPPIQKELESRVLEANQAYRDGKPFLSDMEYDFLEEALKLHYPDSELLKNGKLSISQKQLRKRKLPLEMRSLEKVKSMQEIKDWLDSKEISTRASLILTPKYDGISILRNEETGEAWTSGDGLEGQICTRHLDQAIHKNLNFSGYSIGEGIIPIELWKKYFEGQVNDLSGQTFKASRNTVSGLFNNDNPELASKYLQFVQYIPYTLFGRSTGTLNQSKERMLDWINFVDGEVIIPYVVTDFLSLTEEILEHLFQKWSKDYKIDGIVIDINDGQAREELGYESNGNPAYSRAIKLPQWTEDVTSVIERVERQVSKQGLIKPVVCIAPVQIGDVTVSRANGLNMKFIADWYLEEGRDVSLIRSGDVIPRLKSVEGIEIPYPENYSSQREYLEVYQRRREELRSTLLNSGKLGGSSIGDYYDSRICPCCHSDLEWTSTRVDQYCPNELCFDMVAKKLEYFFSTIGVTKVGLLTCEKLLEYVRDQTLESYDFTNSLSLILSLSITQLMEVEGFGRESANGFHRQIRKIKSQGLPLAKLWDALGYFEGMGEKTLQMILNELKFFSKEDLSLYLVFDEENRSIFEKLVKVDGIGEVTAVKFIEGVLQFYKNSDLLQYFKISMVAEEKAVNSNGHIVCCTDFRFSEEEKHYLHSLGYATTDSFSKKTTILIAKDKSGDTTKLKKAREYGIQILNRSEMKQILR